MQQAILALLLSDLGRGATRLAVGLALAVLICLAFVISTVSAVFFTLAIGPIDLGLPQPARISAGAPGDSVVALARSQIGMPYVWGGASPKTSFDCSGLVQWAYRQLGVALPRTAQQQFAATTRITPDYLRPGDLVFFAQTYHSPHEWITHVGIYVGDGQMINAPTQGDVVREMPVFTGFWGTHYAGAGRVGR